jgi:hypothetical protein
MKKIISNLLKKVFKKFIKKSVTKAVNTPKINAAIIPVNDSKKNLWKFIIQTFISILTAILTALGASSCIGVH